MYEPLQTSDVDLMFIQLQKRHMTMCMRTELQQIEKVTKMYEEFDHFLDTLDGLCKQAGGEWLFFRNKQRWHLLLLVKYMGTSLHLTRVQSSLFMVIGSLII